jgi:hypothetical protein
MRSVMATAHSSPIVSGATVLVGAHEAAQRLGLEAAVGVRDIGPGDAEHAREPANGPSASLRQLAIEAAAGLADLADLLFDTW